MLLRGSRQLLHGHDDDDHADLVVCFGFHAGALAVASCHSTYQQGLPG